MASGALDWPGALQRTLMLAPLFGQEFNPRSSRYPSGDLWKCILGLSVVADPKGTNEADETRLVRIEHVGLSGVIFYSAPPGRASILNDQMVDSEIDALLKRNAVQVLYFPNMACTSFVIGQVMKAHLLSDPTICPKPLLSGSGFSLNPRAFETLSHALVCGSSVPIRDLSGQLKPTTECAERVLKDRRRANHLLLAARYRVIRNTPGVSTPSSLPDALGTPAREEYYDAQDIHHLPSPPGLCSNAVISSFARVNKVPLFPALGDHRRANNLCKTSIDPQSLEKRMKVLELAGEKENEVLL